MEYQSNLETMPTSLTQQVNIARSQLRPISPGNLWQSDPVSTQ